MIKYISIVVIFISGFLFYSNISQNHGPGIVAPNPPDIGNIPFYNQKEISFKGATLNPKKRIEATVRIIDQKRYYFDNYAEYSPRDILIGWDELSDERNLDYIFFSLKDRNYKLKAGKMPFEPNFIHSRVALWTIIPANAQVKNKISDLRKGNVINIQGLLVDLNDSKNYELITAVNFDSKGSKHPFVVWIEDIKVQ